MARIYYFFYLFHMNSIKKHAHVCTVAAERVALDFGGHVNRLEQTHCLRDARLHGVMQKGKDVMMLC